MTPETIKDAICPKCLGTGWYKYDHNHGAICNKCCKHDKGWFDLTEHYQGYSEGLDNACCRAGCGTLRRDIKIQ